jgi:hypothetical protein
VNDPVPVTVDSDVFLCLSLSTTSADDMAFAGVDRLVVLQDEKGLQMQAITNNRNNAEALVKIDDNSQSIKIQSRLMSTGLFKAAVGKRVCARNGAFQIVLHIQEGIRRRWVRSIIMESYEMRLS